MAHSYSHLFSLPTTGLRFFTVYGPWGRPDMAYWKFTEAMFRGTPIEVFGEGLLARDFTYVDDVVDCMERIIASPPGPDPAWNGMAPNPASSSAPYRLYNIGNHSPSTVNEMLDILERVTGRTAQRVHLPKPPGDVDRTFADVSDLIRDFDYSPHTPLDTGLERFVAWYREWQGRS
jgi:UDP-glucuronate 4-epimerase